MDLQCLLANRGERAYLGVLSPGELNVYPINLDRSILAKSDKRTIKQDSSEAPLFFQSVVNGVFTMEGQPDAPDYIFETIRDLMTRSSEILIGTHDLNPLDVLSFLGRALFFRFLWDRRIVRPNELHSVCPKAESLGDCFHNVENSVATCRWLDETFNGDLLPLSGEYTAVFSQANEQTEGRLFLHLQAILEGWKHDGSRGDFNFKSIGVILTLLTSPLVCSVRCMRISAKFGIPDKENRPVHTIHPRTSLAISWTTHSKALARRKMPEFSIRVAVPGFSSSWPFRKLVAARWEQDGKRPDTETIQSILYNQLCGFDVSESALRLAALSLYITAIELNGTPRPPKSLKIPETASGGSVV